MAALGMILFMLGASAMDSTRVFVPTMMVVFGMAMIWTSVRRKA